MDNDEYIEFLKSTLIKIENGINLLAQDTPKHIHAYNKILGVQQKLAGLSKERQAELFTQIVTTRSIINYLMNGRYGEAFQRVRQLKSDLVKICLEIEKSERDTDGQLQKETSGPDNSPPCSRRGGTH